MGNTACSPHSVRGGKASAWTSQAAAILVLAKPKGANITSWTLCHGQKRAPSGQQRLYGAYSHTLDSIMHVTLSGYQGGWGEEGDLRALPRRWLGFHRIRKCKGRPSGE